MRVTKLWRVTGRGVEEIPSSSLGEQPLFTALIEAHEYRVEQIEAQAAEMVAAAKQKLNDARTISDVTGPAVPAGEA